MQQFSRQGVRALGARLYRRLWKRRRHRMATVLACVLVLLLAGLIVGIADVMWEDANFRTVFVGEASGNVYRAGQISHHFWEDEWEERYGLTPFRSVLNLRGAKPGQAWYVEERAFVTRHGIGHVDYKISADEMPTLAQMDTLVEIMRTAPKPLLVHCKNGADRTGLAMALYAYAIAGRPAAEAEEQLSIAYGHFPWLISKTGAMDEAFRAYVQARPQAARRAESV